MYAAVVFVLFTVTVNAEETDTLEERVNKLENVLVLQEQKHNTEMDFMLDELKKSLDRIHNLEMQIEQCQESSATKSGKLYVCLVL